MYVVMITGGLGSGKSELTRLMCEHGALSIDTDAIARDLLENDCQMRCELIEHFGNDIVDGTGAISPALLAKAAFVDDESTQAMNAITFARITERASEYILDAHCSLLTDAKVILVEVPLLNEVPQFANLADEIIAVAAPVELRVERAVARGMDERDVRRRIARQADDDARAKLADIICWNGGTIVDLARWVDTWWSAWKSEHDNEPGPS